MWAIILKLRMFFRSVAKVKALAGGIQAATSRGLMRARASRIMGLHTWGQVMTKSLWLVAGVAFAALGATAFGATNPPPPIATYWVDAATASGMGAGMTAGARPSMSQVMGMMSGQSQVAHTLELTLASRTKPTAAPQADHLIPPGL